ncbi:hypothetical protein SAMN06297144_1683 [Sphingomonas guangdongensis]|uniref:Lipoprotein n=1 Tax=Sphingomonas guangdongensis TaxID=1141890 RepID=A0A285R2I5_9SPHN|nr:hypothetical protein [Sphingomonas guangdongensis]SOB86577.1 hypothetical protein SAMN06297144_1683 [Sphingomonas guangdongensis]
MIDPALLRSVVGVALLGMALPASACAPPVVDTRTPAQVDADVRRQFDAAHDLVRIRMTRTATPARDGRAVVLQSIKGRSRAGKILRISTMPVQSCGYGDAPTGTTHRLYLGEGTTAVFAPLDQQLAAILRRLTLLPTD